MPVGTGREVAGIIEKANPDANFDIASNPEFLREGAAISDFMRPDRVVLEQKQRWRVRSCGLCIAPISDRNTNIIYQSRNIRTDQICQQRISGGQNFYINQMADLCEVVGANVHDVAKGMGLDNRIGNKFLHPGPGYGGSCFPKIHWRWSKPLNCMAAMQYCGCGDGFNQDRKSKMADRVIAAMGGSIADVSIAILGLAFKPETDDMRDSPSLDIVSALAAGAQNCACMIQRRWTKQGRYCHMELHFVTVP